MDEPVQMTGRLLDGLSHLIVAVELKDVRDKIQGILVVLNFCVQSRAVKSVRQIVLVYFAEVFVAARRYEL